MQRGLVGSEMCIRDSNRIGILIKGRFVALDTPKNLTLKYGKGFRIQLYVSDTTKLQEIKARVVERFGRDVTDEEIPESKGKGTLFVIPSSSFNLSEAYQLCHNQLYLEEKLVQKYHIAQSTLEEVFLHLSRMQPQIIEEQDYKEPWQCCCWEFGATGCMCIV